MNTPQMSTFFSIYDMVDRERSDYNVFLTMGLSAIKLQETLVALLFEITLVSNQTPSEADWS